MCQTFSRAVRGIFEPWPEIESKTIGAWGFEVSDSACNTFT